MPSIRQLMDDYERVALEDLHSNLWIISVVVHPDRRAGIIAADMAARRQDAAPRCHRTAAAAPRGRGLSDRKHACRIPTAAAGTTELATDVDGVTLPVTEMGWALHLIRTAIDQQIPHTFGPLSAAIYTEPVVFGPLAFNLNKPKFFARRRDDRI